jgi:hypothetical protein
LTAPVESKATQGLDPVLLEQLLDELSKVPARVWREMLAEPIALR